MPEKIFIDELIKRPPEHNVETNDNLADSLYRLVLSTQDVGRENLSGSG